MGIILDMIFWSIILITHLVSSCMGLFHFFPAFHPSIQCVQGRSKWRPTASVMDDSLQTLTVIRKRIKRSFNTGRSPGTPHTFTPTSLWQEPVVSIKAVHCCHTVVLHSLCMDTSKLLSLQGPDKKLVDDCFCETLWLSAVWPYLLLMDPGGNECMLILPSLFPPGRSPFASARVD